MILLIGELDERDMRIYIKISLAGFCVTRTSLNIGVSFKTIKPVKNWEKTTHFMFGNLLCLSPTGNFKVIFVFLKCIYRPYVSMYMMSLCISLIPIFGGYFRPWKWYHSLEYPNRSLFPIKKKITIFFYNFYTTTYKYTA